MAARYADQVVLMKSGAVVVSGTRDKVLTESAISAVFAISAKRAFTVNGHQTLLFRCEPELSFTHRRNPARGIER